jgi:hypothetical protein
MSLNAMSSIAPVLASWIITPWANAVVIRQGMWSVVRNTRKLEFDMVVDLKGGPNAQTGLTDEGQGTSPIRCLTDRKSFAHNG